MIKEQLTIEEARIVAECAKDINKFYQYAQIISENGYESFKPRKFQKDMLNGFVNSYESDEPGVKRNYIVKSTRQCGFTTGLTVYALWFAIFHPERCVGIMAPKDGQATEILYRVRDMYAHLPEFLRPKTKTNNRSCIRFENNTQIFACAASSSSVRGKTVDLLIIDDFAHMGGRETDDFMMSVFPTQASRMRAQMIIGSTPTTTKHPFCMLYAKAKMNLNSFNTIEIPWNCTKERDTKWKKKMIRDYGEDFFKHEFGGEFMEE